MRHRATIPYVAVDPGAPDPTDVTFGFTRLRHTTFINVPDDAPHRHDFHELLLVVDGRLRHTVDGETVDLGPHSLAVIARGQVHHLDRAIEVEGWALRFTEDMVPAAPDLAFLVSPGTSPTIALSTADVSALMAVADLIEVEAVQPFGPERDRALGALLVVLLLRIGRIRRALGADPVAREDQQIYRDFVCLLERDFAEHHGVAHYAGALAVDPVRLSAVLTRVLGMPTKRAIDDRLVLETKRLLRHSSLPLKTIARELGYADQFHLSKVFKRLTGHSPQEFRHPEKVT